MPFFIGIGLSSVGQVTWFSIVTNLGHVQPWVHETIFQTQKTAKKLQYIIEHLLNQSRNKYSQDIIYMKNYVEEKFFFTYL
jgi:hypothetical protein